MVVLGVFGTTMTVLGNTVLALQLHNHDFKDTAACLGPQVAAVLDDLIMLPELSSATWYAAAFEMIWPVEIREALQVYAANQPVPIVDIRSFIPLVRKVGQFLDGVIFSVPLGDAPVVATKLLTADGPISKQVTNSIVEICAFDTSWIEVVTDVSALIEQLQKRFGGQMVYE